jgi:2-keto-4-pentenoate hydratase/2-oxohepta-3-ene-1,7-dioic acid hydratase in catechol pathway
VVNLASVVIDGAEAAAVVDPQRGVVLVDALVPDAPAGLLELLEADRVEEVCAAARRAGNEAFVPAGSVTFAAPYRRPRKIWGIGLNYVEHADDLAASVPDEPVIFLKGEHTVVGPGEPIPVPRQSGRTTAEAELGLVIGRECREVTEGQALSYVAGVVPVLDQTAEDILERNPRFLTRAKNFPGFFSFGPQIVLARQAGHSGSVHDVMETLADLAVMTVLNGRVHRTNTVANMRFSPAFLVSFSSQVMPLHPGDVLSTGTPGAVRIRGGDVAECRIPSIGVLRNPVVDQR